MGIIVDLILIICFVSFVGIGYMKGLTGSLYKLLSFVIAIVLAFVLYKPVAGAIIDKTQIDDKIKESIITTFGKEEANQTTTEDGIQTNIMENINKEIANATVEAKNSIVEQSAERITTTILNVGTGIVIFLLARIVLLIISFFVKGVANLPILKQVDKIGGIAYGAAEGLIIIFVVLGIVSFSSVLWNGNKVVTAVEKSAIGSVLYNNNMIINMLF